MIGYLIKTILCSAILLLVYFLLLEKEKAHRFNRFYLLFSIGFSFLVPFITIEGQKEVLPFADPVYVVIDKANPTPAVNKQPPDEVQKDKVKHSSPLALLYVAITASLLFRFVRNLFSLFKKIKAEQKLRYQNATLVLCHGCSIPYSFLHYIFLDKEAYESGTIEKEILHHELVHVRQKHSWDILFIELLLSLAWFNPFLYGYKKAIRLNHEFLADDEVVKTFRNTTSYQYLLLNKISSSSHSLLTSSFNYLTTKKRILMMMKTTSPVTIALKQFALLPLVALLIFLFSTKLIAQVINQPAKPVSSEKEQDTIKKDTVKPFVFAGMSVGYTKEGASEELMKEYQHLVNKYKRSDSIQWKDFENVSAEDRSRMEAIYKQMSKEQQSKQVVLFLKNPWPLPKVVPTKEQFNRFKNPDLYGIWLNGKKVPNEELNKYENTDFSQVFVSNLYGAAKKGKRYSYQADLMTNEYYKEYYDKTMAETKKSRMVVVIEQGKRFGVFSIK
jgi:bla regulator protein blaR1